MDAASVGVDSMSNGPALGSLLGTAGAVLCLGGWQLLRTWSFPILLMLFMLPKLAVLYNQATLPLQLLASQMAAGMLTMTGVGVIRNAGGTDLFDTSNGNIYGTWNFQSGLQVGAGVGAKAPDGPTLDLPPGKYKFSFKAGNAPAQSDENEIAADETWGILIGPGGAVVRIDQGGALAYRARGDHVIVNRHGDGFPLPPHAINYRANLRALADLGFTDLVSLNSVGSLKPELPPGTADLSQGLSTLP